MGIYLPNMEMPRKGQMLVIFPDGTSYVCFNGMRERLTQTTAVPVPNHGRLIDADALLKDDSRKYDMYRGANGRDTMLDDVCHRAIQWTIDDAPTIIPKEGET